jgi:hypothetical protein
MAILRKGTLYIRSLYGELIQLGEVDEFEVEFVSPGARSGEDTADSPGA